MSSGRECQEAACLLDFVWVGVPKRGEKFLGVCYGLEEFRLVLRSYEFDKLLEAQHEFEIALVEC